MALDYTDIEFLDKGVILKTGKVLPLWKAASMAIEGFSQAEQNKKGRHIQA